MNGRLSAGELVTVQGPIRLSLACGLAWRQMEAAAAKAGIALDIASPYGGYRDYAAQQYLFTHPAAINPYSTVPVAAPGSSTHGTGTRVDVANFSGARAAWLLANAAKFGFTREFGAADPNHFVYKPVGGIMATVAEIWGRLVSRGDKQIPAIQELADAKTNTILILAEVRKVLAEVLKPRTLVLSPADRAAIIAGVIAGLPTAEQIANKTADVIAERGRA